MTLRDWLILGFSFFVGMFSGAYLYVTEFRPIYIGDTTNVPEQSAYDLSIIGIIYGGNAPSSYEHPSFRVLEDGSYDYFPGGEGAIQKQEGVLPDELARTLRNVTERADLDALAKLSTGKACASYRDGIEYTYNIERDGVEYEIDTCATVFSNDTTLGRVLLDVWRYLDKPDEYRFSIQNFPDVGITTDERCWTIKCFIERRLEQSGFDSAD